MAGQMFLEENRLKRVKNLKCVAKKPCSLCLQNIRINLPNLWPWRVYIHPQTGLTFPGTHLLDTSDRRLFHGLVTRARKWVRSFHLCVLRWSAAILEAAKWKTLR